VEVYEISRWEDNTAPDVEIFKKLLSKSNDTEGLCYDSGRKALLIACKENPDSDTLRTIFAFDLAKKKIRQKIPWKIPRFPF